MTWNDSYKMGNAFSRHFRTLFGHCLESIVLDEITVSVLCGSQLVQLVIVHTCQITLLLLEVIDHVLQYTARVALLYPHRRVDTQLQNELQQK